MKTVQGLAGCVSVIGLTASLVMAGSAAFAGGEAHAAQPPGIEGVDRMDASGPEILLAEADLKTTARRGKRGASASKSGNGVVVQSKGRGKTKSARTGRAEVTANTASTIGTRRGNRGASHAQNKTTPVPQAPIERFFAGLFAPASTWEKAMVLVAPAPQAEPLWLDQIRPGPEGTYLGQISTDPALGQGAVSGEMIFSRADIRDWGFVDQGTGYGFETLRAKGGVETFAALAPDVLPSGW